MHNQGRQRCRFQVKRLKPGLMIAPKWKGRQWDFDSLCVVPGRPSQTRSPEWKAPGGPRTTTNVEKGRESVGFPSPGCYFHWDDTRGSSATQGAVLDRPLASSVEAAIEAYRQVLRLFSYPVQGRYAYLNSLDASALDLWIVGQENWL